MNTVQDEDLVLLYYGEHEDPGLARRVARTPELHARFTRLTELLEKLDDFPLPEAGPDFGARIWHRIAPRLDVKRSRWRAALEAFHQPLLSMSAVAALLIVVIVSFWLGRQSSPAAHIDPQLLLAGQVSAHLGRTDMFLTEYVNTTDTTDEAAWAAELLLANRIYRRAADGAGHTRLAGLLDEMETLLIELANGGGQRQADARQLKNYVNGGLLFRVRVMQDKLVAQPQKA